MKVYQMTIFDLLDEKEDLTPQKKVETKKPHNSYEDNF